MNILVIMTTWLNTPSINTLLVKFFMFMKAASLFFSPLKELEKNKEISTIIESGMVCLIPSCAPHRSELNDKTVYRRTLLFLNPWIYSRSFYSDPINDMLMGFRKRPLAAKDTFGCADLLNKLADEIKTNDLLSEGVSIALMTQLLTGIMRHSGFINDNCDYPDKLVFEVKEFIQQNCALPLQISDIADKFYINKYYLSHIFKEQTGMSPRQFLTFARISKAYSLLHEPSLKISEISDMCGFSSPSDMSRRFREHYGISQTPAPLSFVKRKAVLNLQFGKNIAGKITAVFLLNLFKFSIEFCLYIHLKKIKKCFTII